MNIASFKKKYDLDLIPTGNEEIIIGTLVWDPLVGGPKFSHAGMPANIFQAFLDAGLLNRNEFDAWIEKCRNTPLVEAELATVVVDVDLHVAAELNLPIADFVNDFSYKNISKFEFGNVKSRLMTFDVRIEADSLLEQMRAKKWADYDGKMRRLFVIKELYYGTSIKITINKDFKNDFDLKLKQYNLKAKLVAEGSITKTYEFSNKNVPFAMRTTPVKTFNG